MPNESVPNDPTGARTGKEKYRMYRIVKAYYQDDKKQDAIAKEEGISRQLVTKILQQARDEELITFHIRTPIEDRYLANTATQLRELYGLQDVAVVPAILNGPDEGEQPARETILPVAQEGAKYINQVLTRGEGNRLVISPGRIIRHLVHSLRPDRPLGDLQVVPFLGFYNIIAPPYEASITSWDFARAYGAQHFFLPTEAYMPEKKLRAQVEQLPGVARALEIAKTADLVVTGIGDPRDKLERRLSELNDEQQKELHEPPESLRSTVVGELAGQFYKADGSVIDDMEVLFGHFVGLDLATLRGMVSGGKARSIGIVGGDLTRVDGIIGAIQAQYINILITDHITAHELLKRHTI